MTRELSLRKPAVMIIALMLYFTGPFTADAIGDGGDATLDISVTIGDLANRVSRCKIKISGDASTGYTRREKSQSASLLNSGYITFHDIPSGTYNIDISGYHENGDIAFSLGIDHYLSSGHSICDANVSSKTFYCH